MSDREVALQYFRKTLPLIVHGLRNKVSPAFTLAHMLEEGGLPPDKVRQIAHSVIDSLDALLALMAALPRLVELELGQTSEVELNAWLAAAANKAGVALTLTGEARQVMLETGLWSVAVGEALQNVAHHGGTSAQGVWSIAGERLEVRLRDYGAGLGKMGPDRALEATRRSESSPGQGLGLARATLAMLLLDGSVRIEPREPGLEVVLEGRLRAA